MRIKKILHQHRRDFTAIYICDNCDTEAEGRGYDDANFHNNVIPKMKCKSCGCMEVDFNEDYRPLATKYPEGMQI